jgi:hypothetical protein
MKTYTFYSETHKVFLPWFNTIKEVEPDVDVEYLEVTQTCPSGEFAEEGWNKTMADKVEYVLSAFDHPDEYFIYSDLDVQFFQPITPLAQKVLAKHDIVFQNDSNGVRCAGFFYCRKTESTKKLFQKTLEIIGKHRDDQPAIHEILTNELVDVKTAFLPPQFFTFGAFYQHWNGQQVFPLPKGIVVHHANWVIGIDNKLKLLQAVRNNYNNKNFVK